MSYTGINMWATIPSGTWDTVKLFTWYEKLVWNIISHVILELYQGVKLIPQDLGENIFVLLDNQAAVGALQKGRTSSSKDLTQKVRDTVLEARVEVKWIPGHSNISGNEEADVEARTALSRLPPRQCIPKNITLAYQRQLMEQRRQQLVEDWWAKACPARYRDLDLLMRRRKPPKLALSRQLLHSLIAVRTVHGDFASCHENFKHEDATMECICGQTTSPTQFIRCRNHAFVVRKFGRNLTSEGYTCQLLGLRGLERFNEFLQTTGCFGKAPIYSSSTGREESIH